jgi:hypothetical protein
MKLGVIVFVVTIVRPVLTTYKITARMGLNDIMTKYTIKIGKIRCIVPVIANNFFLSYLSAIYPVKLESNKVPIGFAEATGI